MPRIKSFLIIMVLIILYAALFAQSPAQAQSIGQEGNSLWEISQKDFKHAKNAHYWARKNRWVDSNLHAKKSDDPIISNIFRWLQYINGSKYTKFTEISQFINDNPSWPKQKTLHRNLELSINMQDSPQKIIAWFTQYKDPKSQRRKFNIPTTITGKRILAEALINIDKDTSRENKHFISKMIKDVWEHGTFSAKEEVIFLSTHQKILSQANFQARMENLLWKNKAISAQRILSKITDKQLRLLYDVRIKLQKNKYGLDKAIKRVSKQHTNDEGLLYDRTKWRSKHGTQQGVIELLKKIPQDTKYPAKWWAIKKKYFSSLLDNKQYKDAYDLAANHGFTDDISKFAQAHWQAGWIAYIYQNNPQKAYQHFYEMFSRVQTPVSLGRASYWAARMAQANENQLIAQKWYNISAKYSSSFYGQLATEKLGKSALIMPTEIALTTADYESYNNNELLKAAYILKQLGRNKHGREFVLQAIENAQSVEEKTLITQFGTDIDRRDYSVIAAKKLSYTSQAFDLINNYPVLDNLNDVKNRAITAPESSLIHSVILQESIFDNNAKSHVGALGLMQLMPATAKEVAKKLKIRYSKSKLQKINYNITLGSKYLDQLIKQFDGSYILAIAAYNGGQGNVRKWIKRNGDPRKMDSLDEIIIWIEKIPFAETQNYVQRVIENLQIYRYKINDSSLAYVHIGKDLMR